MDETSSRIKGITVEIGGSTAGLNRALAGTNKEIGSTQSQLKDVERLLKLDPSNTELLEQRQRLLSDAVNQTRQKLETLKNAEVQVQEQFKAGKVSAEQYEGLQREIVATENSLKDLEKQAKSSNDTLSKISTISGNISSKAAGVAKATAPLTGAVAATGALAVKAMDNVDQGLDVVIQKTGATGAAAKELQAVYNDVAQTIPGDFEDIGSAVGEINTRLDFTGEKLRAASEQFLKFAKVNGTDVNTSVQLVTRAMGDAGLSADEYGSILDALTVAGQKSGVSIDALTTNLAKYGAPLRALGIDTKNAIALFAGWEKAGVNTEIAFSGMKKAISEWGKQGKDSRVEFQKAMADIKAAPTIADATSKAIEAFGSKAGPDLADAIQGGRFEVEQYISALENAGGTVESTYGMIVDEVDDTQLAMQTAQVAMHDIGETIAKTLGPWLKKLALGLKEVTDWFNGLDSGAQGAILTIIAVIAAISPLAGVISGVGKAISVLTSTVLPALNGALAALAANPIALAIAAIVIAIAALVAGFIYLWNNCEDFRNFWIDLWDNVSKFFTDCWNGIVEFFTKKIPNAWNSVVNFFKSIPEWWRGLWKKVGDFFVGLWNSIVEFVNSLPYKIGYAIGQVIGFFASIPGRIKYFLVQAVQNVKQWGVDTFSAAKEWVTKTISDIGTWFSELPGEIWSWLKETINKVVSWGAEMVQKAKSAVTDFVTKIVDTVKSLPGKMLEVGKDIVRGVWNGITSMFSWIHEKVSQFFGGIVDGVKDTLGIHSPSKVFASIGDNMAAGVGVGFLNQMKAVQKKMQTAIPTDFDIDQNMSATKSNAVAAGLSVEVRIDSFNNYDTAQDVKQIAQAVSDEIAARTARLGVAYG